MEKASSPCCCPEGGHRKAAASCHSTTLPCSPAGITATSCPRAVTETVTTSTPVEDAPGTLAGVLARCSVLPPGRQQAVSLTLSIASSSPQDQKATSEVPSHLLLPRISCPAAATTFQQSKRARTPGKKRGTLRLSASTLQHAEPPLQATRTLPPGSPGARAGRTRDKALQRALRASRKAFSSPVPSEPGQSRCSRGVQPAAHRDGGRRLPELALS